MASPKKQELIYFLTLQSFKEECIAIISKYIYDRSEVQSLYDITAAELLEQNVNNVREMPAFIKTAMRNKAKAYFKDRLNQKETPTNDFNEQSAIDPVFSHMEFTEVRKAIKQHRSELDFKLFEMVWQGYSYKQITNSTAETMVSEGAWRKRWCDLRKWLKMFFDEK